MKKNSPAVSGELLREGLMEKAEELAANYLKVAPRDLPATIRRWLRSLVDGVILAPGGRNRERPRTDPTPVDRDSDDDYECEHCHRSYPRGTYASPYASACPPMMAYPPMASYAPQYRPRRGFLHHLLCPCWWCRGGW